jgi:thiaminase/transcriptional activator TenA
MATELGLHKEQLQTTRPATTCLAYTSFLVATAFSRPFHEGLAALLPYHWVYQKVGRALAQKSSPDPLYQRWIDTYGGPVFDKAVREVLALTDQVRPELASSERAAMRECFVIAARYEWMFWDMAFRLQRWPV